MIAVVDTIATHTATGAGDSHELGDGSTPGRAANIASPIRHIHISGTFSATIKLEGSMDGSNWVDWLTGITAVGWYIVEDGPRYMRSNCTAYTSGTVTVKAQKFVEN